MKLKCGTLIFPAEFIIQTIQIFIKLLNFIKVWENKKSDEWNGLDKYKFSVRNQYLCKG